MAASTRTKAVYGAVLLVLAVVAAIVVKSVWKTATHSLAYDHCTVGDYDLDPDQAAVASTMVGVVTKRHLPERAAVLALAAGLQESKLRNLPPNAGDRDSVGVLQQRPSQGWGTATELNDVHFATGAFLDALVKIDGWPRLDLATAVQDVQFSADGSAYAQHEPEAQQLADVLTGKPPAGITCQFAAPTKVAAASTVATQVRTDLPVNLPSAAGTSVSVPGAAWQTAAWFVANADRLGIDQVAYNGKRWTRTKGWRADSAGSAAVVATMATLKK